MKRFVLFMVLLSFCILGGCNSIEPTDNVVKEDISTEESVSANSSTSADVSADGIMQDLDIIVEETSEELQDDVTNPDELTSEEEQEIMQEPTKVHTLETE